MMNFAIKHPSLTQPALGLHAYWSVDCGMTNSIREPRKGQS